VNLLYTYLKLIQSIENESFASEELKTLQQVFVRPEGRASKRFGKLAQLAGELDQRANLLIHMLLNPLLLWDIRKAVALEDWKRRHGSELLSWISALGETSLRTSDSLNDNESYFFAELKRLKLIIDELHTGKPLFIILDEILKGTNSVDKQKGSLALPKT
jgi:hypothetical protein